MKIVLATGIYPPDIGGPATYVAELAQRFAENGHRVTVISYGRAGSEKRPIPPKVTLRIVSNSGGVLRRWFRYKRQLLEASNDADAVIAFTSVSVGIPLILSRIRTPRKILRLGGEFFWERATDAGSMQSLRAWHQSRFGFWRILHACFMESILRSFDRIVYSTHFQHDIHTHAYPAISSRMTVLENACPALLPVHHKPHDPFKLLFVGRFVQFKNIPALLEALLKYPDATLTLAGEGPMNNRLVEYVRAHGLQNRVTFLPPVFGQAKQKIFAEHDLLVIPSITEISPNIALEARSAGLPVLLTQETGLSSTLANGMMLAPMSDSTTILAALMKARSRYAELAAALPAQRSWNDVTNEWISLLSSLV